ncbi:hypothetical protein DCS_06988 [Drechmeria coniospora]|uniref:Uncharacterized protein n=1 Tax=Drechmeria coniospora TaxID=98403 RepID=A0A151GD51_DRECN|nr:hypothetical protein DCS_06988 [Drechmeria coniospora]KYK55027.1 hypothetical protein DCS_06988 [Drechmeria coniospora]
MEARGSLVDYGDDDDAESLKDAPSQGRSMTFRSPLTRTRSLSDGGGTTPCKLSPSPHIVESSRRTSKDDSALQDQPLPVTPRRSDLKPLSVRVPSRQCTPPPPVASNPYVKPTPLSPKLDHSQTYASPTNILPRRSRGLDFSRAATSLHHSTLAEQSSPDSSPINADRAMNIPSRRSEYGGPEQTSTSLWSIMGKHDRMHMSNSLGSNQAIVSDSSSSSDGDILDEDMDDAYVTTPQVKSGPDVAQAGTVPGFGNLVSFQQRQRPRKQAKKRGRGPLGLGFNLSTAVLSKSPPNPTHARRESISWQANQLHISSVETDEGTKSQSDADGTSGDGQRSVIRRTVTRRGNLLPKTKTFARIRAALAEEGAPADAETRREAEVVKQVRESDVDLERRMSTQGLEPSAAVHGLSSPNLASLDPADDVAEEEMAAEAGAGLSSSFKQHAMKNSKGKTFWDTFSESSSVCGNSGNRTPPPPVGFLPRGSSSGVSEDATMDSPSLAGPSGYAVPQPRHESLHAHTSADWWQGSQHGSGSGPSAAEITRRINNKRRRDDDFDPTSLKRRAVSPGMSAHNSPVLQSPMQRDSAAWGSRPGSNGGERGGSNAASESGSMGGTPSNQAGRPNGKGRVGFQGMVDTNDGIMRMSIE